MIYMVEIEETEPKKMAICHKGDQGSYKTVKSVKSRIKYTGSHVKGMRNSMKGSG
jgi:hypothetical protein